MNRLVRRLAAAAVALAALSALACASGTKQGAAAQRRNVNVITAEELQTVQFSNLFDVVQALRFRWLQSRGPDSINMQSGQVQVRLDDTQLGGVETLRNIPPAGVVSIQWVDPNTAAGRWGMGYGHGAILVSTRRAAKP